MRNLIKTGKKKGFSSHLRKFCAFFDDGKTGQHTLEYITLITLISAGIIIMGPYVLRSWNANLQGWEDSVVDSLQDPLLEAGVDTVVIAGCDQVKPPCWIDVVCGGSRFNPCTGGNTACSEVEMLSYVDYDPPGCQCELDPPATSVKCTIDDCCCTAPVSTGRCGATATVVTGEQSKPGCSATTLGDRNDDGTCSDGMVEAWIQCGNDGQDTKRYGCINDPSCNFSCLNVGPDRLPPIPEAIGWCDANFDQGLTSTMNVTYVDNGGCPIDPSLSKCLAECEPDSRATEFGCDPCVPPLSTIVLIWDANGGTKDCYATIGWGVALQECLDMGALYILLSRNSDNASLEDAGKFPCVQNINGNTSWGNCITLQTNLFPASTFTIPPTRAVTNFRAQRMSGGSIQTFDLHQGTNDSVDEYSIIFGNAAVACPSP